MLVASLAISVGLAIYDLTAREIDLSSTATQSQYAVYAADTGAECALYWDAKYTNAGTNNNGGSRGAFSTSTADTLAPGSGASLWCNTLDVSIKPPVTDIARYKGGDLGSECSGNTGTTWCQSKVAASATTTFEIKFTSLTPPQPYCADVQVVKYTNPSGVLFTTISSRGYNTCIAGGVRVERTLQISY